MILASEIFVFIYSILMIVFIIIWLKNKAFNTSDKSGNEAFSIIIPVRNEAKNIKSLLESIKIQKFKKFEVIVIDDASEDDTLLIANGFLGIFDLKILKLSKEERGNAPKKNAITKALEIAKYDLIFCTDGDCILPENILENYSKIFENQKIKFISGPVTFFEKSNSFFGKIWDKIQIVEFASLVGSAAVSIFSGKPNMCSGANIAYRKSVFYEVNGYEGNLNLASGDDEFLMHKISEKYPESIIFAKSKDCIVETNSCENLKDFYNQRKRWASKWSHYETFTPKMLAIFIFFVNVSTIYLALKFAIGILLIRFLLEFTFLGMILFFLKKKTSIFYIPIVQLIYPFYVLFFGIISIFMKKSYNWKNREMQ